MIDFNKINVAGMACLPAILSRILPDGKAVAGEWVARNPTRNDRRAGSFKVSLINGRWSDFATGDKGGDIVSLVAYVERVSQGEAAKMLAAMLGMKGDGA